MRIIPTSASTATANDLPTPPDTVYVRHIKGWFDRAAGGVLLVTTLPVQLTLALVVRRYLGSPVLFRQERPGVNGQPFMMFKFRTMTDERDGEGVLLPDNERLTQVGRFLRSSSLDELPELINIVRGEMSLVGPRPLLMRYLDRYTPRQSQRMAVRPGITGLAQVSGRNMLTWNEKFELDLEYIENVSLTLDLRILWQTLWNVVARKDISAEGHATMPEFGVNTAA